MPAAVTPLPAALAETLLREWEQRTRPAANFVYEAARPRVLAHLAALCETLRPASMMVDGEDVRAVLGCAASFALGAAVASGPGRAAQAARLALADSQAHRLGPFPTGSAFTSLLAIRSHPATPLAMDELTIITEAIHDALGPDGEMVFGHDETDALAGSELHLWLLVGYGIDTFLASNPR